MWFWFNSLILSLKFEDHPISGCWDIQPFNILKSSSIGGHLCFKHFLILFGPLRLTLKFEGNPKYSIFNILRSSFIGGRLPLEVVFELRIFYFGLVFFHWWSSSFQAFFIFVWSPKLKFKIWVKSNGWLLRYSTFNILRSSSILPLVVVFISSMWFWFNVLHLSLKFEENPTIVEIFNF